MVLRNFIYQIILIDVLLMATYLIAAFYVNSAGSSYNFFFIDAGRYSSMEGEIATFNNRISIYFYK